MIKWLVLGCYVSKQAGLRDFIDCYFLHSFGALVHYLGNNIIITLIEVGQLQIIYSYLFQAEEMDTLISELANVNDVEKALVEECGNLLAKTHTLQVNILLFHVHCCLCSIRE